MNIIRYMGCFFDPKELEKNLEIFSRKPLYKTISCPHITLLYRPSNVPTGLLGTKIQINVIGYGNDGQNEALLVEFVDFSDGLKDIIADVPVPHITLSVSKSGKSVNSRYLEFKPIEPFALVGTVGVMDSNDKVCT